MEILKYYCEVFYHVKEWGETVKIELPAFSQGLFCNLSVDKAKVMFKRLFEKWLDYRLEQ